MSYTASDALRQAGATVDTYLREAIKSIDGALGNGYASEHPELLAAFIQGCTDDFAQTVGCGIVEGTLQAAQLNALWREESLEE